MEHELDRFKFSSGARSSNVGKVGYCDARSHNLSAKITKQGHSFKTLRGRFNGNKLGHLNASRENASRHLVLYIVPGTHLEMMCKNGNVN